MEIKEVSTVHKWSWQTRCYIGLLIAYIGILVNWRAEVMRFESPAVNYVVMLIGLAVPIALVPLAFGFKGWGRKIVGAIFPLLLIPLSLLLGMFSWIMLADISNTGIDSSFERLECIQLPHSRVTVYRTNGGATTDFGVALRHEMTLLPGVLLVRRIESLYPAYEAKVTTSGGNIVKVVVAPYGDQVEQNLTLTLKRWVYF
jgi:hypothetical protein